MRPLALQPFPEQPPGCESVTLEVWRFSLEVAPRALADLRTTLSDDERERAARFRFRRDAERFVSGRGQLRRILAGLLGEESATLRFAYGGSGKPSVQGQPDLGFNLAHSHTLALLAVARGTDVGVDVESGPPPQSACEEIAPSFFAPEEAHTLMALPAAQRDAAFLRCWTRKEAYVKALGDGLQIPLQDFAVSLAPEEPARLRWCRRAGERERWTLLDLSHCFEGASAAACVGRPVSRVCLHEAPV